MNCPSCGAKEKTSVKFCNSCGEAFTSQDLLELYQLEYLVKETARWKGVESRRKLYEKRLKDLRVRMLKRDTDSDESGVEIEAAPKLKTNEGIPEPALSPQTIQTSHNAPPRERVSFDQWLLSERNIKIALFSGGVLLLLAGLIFVGVNWTRIPGSGKIAITLIITVLMYLGGYLLFRRPKLRLGGTALLGIASGFLILNFVVLQTYILGPAGLANDVMWLICSLICLPVYIFTAYLTRSGLFTYLSSIALGSTMTAVLVVVNTNLATFILAFALLLLVLLILAQILKSSRVKEFTFKPLLILSQVSMPVVIGAATFGWIFISNPFLTSYTGSRLGNPWLALLSLSIGVLFYMLTDVFFRFVIARWIASILLVGTLSLVFIELEFSDKVIGISLMILALVYIVLGYFLERREGQRKGAWPLYVTGYMLAVLVTIMAIPDLEDLARILLGDVVILVISAIIHRDYRWVYAAVWLLILPFYLFINLSVPELYIQGLLIGLLGLIYAVTGYIFGRKELRLGGPFLTASAFLTIFTIVLTWENPIICSMVLVLVAALYLLEGLWLGWQWLLFPSILSINLGILALHRIITPNLINLEHPLVLSYFFLGVILAIGALILRRTGKSRWAWPLYITGALDLVGSYLVGFVIGGWLAITLSLIFSLILLIFAWMEQSTFIKFKSLPLLTYIGLIVIFVGHFYVIDEIVILTWGNWPAYTATLWGLFIVLSWFLRREKLNYIYASPLRYTGLILLVIPMAGSLILLDPILGAVTFSIATVVYGADAAIRRNLRLAYLSLGTFIVVIWAVLIEFDVTEYQAYFIPLGLVSLGIGWIERLRSGGILYRLFTLLGLIVLMGSSFIQSILSYDYTYALLLLGESLASIGWGIWTRTRCFVQIGGLALILNAIVQLGPGFVELPRWIQIGVTGILLLGGGLAALFKREDILSTRRKITDEWQQWQP